MRHQTLLARLNDAHTISGLSIYIEETHPQNEFRSRACQLTTWIAHQLETEHIPDILLSDALSILQREYRDQRHYGENKPGSFFESGRATSPDATFNYWDFFGFAISGYSDHFLGFARDIELDRRLTYRIVCGLISLLLIDEAIRFLGIGHVFRASAWVFDAHEAFDEMMLPRRYERIAQETRRAQATNAANAKNSETNEYKRLVIEEWKSGRFTGNKSEAARWATKEYPLKSQESVRRWLRAYEKGR